MKSRSHVVLAAQLPLCGLQHRQGFGKPGGNSRRKGNRATDGVERTGQLRQCSRGRHLHDQAVVDTPVYIQRDILAIRPARAFNVHGPQHERELDKEHVVRNMTPRADPPTKAERDVAFVFSIRRCWSELASHGINMPGWIEEMCIRAEDTGVSVDGPDVGDEKRALRDEVAFVPNILGKRFMSRFFD